MTEVCRPSDDVGVRGRHECLDLGTLAHPRSDALLPAPPGTGR
jgi:hypothetical protein